MDFVRLPLAGAGGAASAGGADSAGGAGTAGGSAAATDFSVDVFRLPFGGITPGAYDHPDGTGGLAFYGSGDNADRRARLSCVRNERHAYMHSTKEPLLPLFWVPLWSIQAADL